MLDNIGVLYNETQRYGEAEQAYAQVLQEMTEAADTVGGATHVINYRHIIWSLVRKLGAFARIAIGTLCFPRSLSPRL